MSGSQAPHCGYMHLHEEVIQRVNQEMPEEETLFDLEIGRASCRERV